MLISKIKAGSYQNGLVAGRKESVPWIVISAAIAGGVLIYEEGPKLVSAVKDWMSKKTVTEEAAAAEDILLNKIKEANKLENEKNHDMDCYAPN